MDLKCIYEVRYDIQWHSAAAPRWERQSVRVCAGPDALEAVEKARVAALHQHQLDDNGRDEHCSDFRLREVILVAEAQL
jgi:hypothetical protein